MGAIAMDSVSMNHYEKQLYTVFKTFDVDNEEALNKSAVLDLCDALQLEDRGAALVDTLFERRADRVTFAQFRNGLLSVLGGAAPAASSPPAAASAPAVPSDDDSSGREVAPKFVFGSKKYGRRSRPRSPAAADDSPGPRAASVSRLDTDKKQARNSQRMKYRRSTSAMDTRNRFSDDDNDASPDGFDHDRHVDREQALALCHRFRMDGIDRRLVDSIFEELSADDVTVGEFFDRLNASLTSSLERTQDNNSVPLADVDDAIDDESGAGIASTLIIEAWEGRGIAHPQRLLNELGFTSPVLSPPELERALDDELRAYEEPTEESRDTQILFLVAALELSRFRLRHARKRADVAAAERDKLRTDVAEANRRARLLAQDNDESHARLEAELAASVRRADARLADAARRAAADAAAERERAAAARADLLAELTQRTAAERNLKEHVDAQNSRIAELESRFGAAEARAAAAERAAAEERAARLAAPDLAAHRAPERDERLLAERLAELRRENDALRDRNDELCAELARSARPAAAAARPPGDLSAELAALLPAAHEDCDSAPASIDRGVMSWAEAARRLRGLASASAPSSPEAAAGCTACGARDARLAELAVQLRNLSDELALAPNLQLDKSNAYAQTESEGTEVDPLEETEELRRELAETERRHDEEKLKLSEIVKDLEGSLEQMKAEYDKCEEYWSSKLEEERAAHGAEQRAADDRLADLVAKIADFERLFAPPAPPAAPARALPPIEERAALEAQVTELEEEFAAYRRRAEEERAAREARLARLAARLAARAPCACAALAERCARLAAAGGAGAREALALRARAGRAEQAVRRLTARLAAADLLVKDLYVENCQLAHRAL